jgi:type II secretory pathway pseudopilin PulG
MLTQSVVDRQPTHGFLLLEILVALFIFIIGSTSVWALWSAATETHREALVEQNISMLAESLVAEVSGVYLRQGMALPAMQNVASQHFPGYQYDILGRDLGENAVLLTISIRYNRYGRPQQEILHTVLYRTVFGG